MTYGSRLLIHSQSQDNEGLTVYRSGKKVYDKSLPRDVVHAKHGHWKREWKKQENDFHQEMRETRHYPAIQGEPHIWECLKRAKNATGVRAP